jgi:hypothetical protein
VEGVLETTSLLCGSDHLIHFERDIECDARLETDSAITIEHLEQLAVDIPVNPLMNVDGSHQTEMIVLLQRNGNRLHRTRKRFSAGVVITVAGASLRIEVAGVEFVAVLATVVGPGAVDVDELVRVLTNHPAVLTVELVQVSGARIWWQASACSNPDECEANREQRASTYCD